MADAPAAGAIALEGQGLAERGRDGTRGRVGLTLVPYSLWGNRGRGALRVFLRADPGSR